MNHKSVSNSVNELFANVNPGLQSGANGGKIGSSPGWVTGGGVPTAVTITVAVT